MSRVGKLPISIPKGTEVKIDGGFVVVKGPKGELKEALHPKIKIEIADDVINLKIGDETDKGEKSLWGLFRSLINNMVVGVNQHYEKKLEVNGVGYNAQLKGSNILVLNVGYSHPVEFNIPKDITVQVEKNIVKITGADKKLVGETAARIKKIRKPEPYKGTGIKYADEILRRKAGKTSAK